MHIRLWHSQLILQIELEGNFSSVRFSSSIVSNSLWPLEPQHARPPCPSPTPRVHPNSCALSRWCHPAISSSVVPFSCPQSLRASVSFPISQLFAWGETLLGTSRWAIYSLWFSRSIGSFSLSISLSNEHPGLVSFRMDWLDLLAVQGTGKSLLLHHSSKASILWRSALYMVQLLQPYMTTGNCSFD